MRFGAVWLIWTHYVRFDMWFHIPLSKKYFEFLTKQRIFRLKPHAAPKFEEKKPQTAHETAFYRYQNRKTHLKPHFKEPETATRNTLRPPPI